MSVKDAWKGKLQEIVAADLIDDDSTLTAAKSWIYSITANSSPAATASVRSGAAAFCRSAKIWAAIMSASALTKSITAKSISSIMRMKNGKTVCI